MSSTYSYYVNSAALEPPSDRITQPNHADTHNANLIHPVTPQDSQQLLSPDSSHIQSNSASPTGNCNTPAESISNLSIYQASDFSNDLDDPFFGVNFNDTDGVTPSFLDDQTSAPTDAPHTASQVQTADQWNQTVALPSSSDLDDDDDIDVCLALRPFADGHDPRTRQNAPSPEAEALVWSDDDTSTPNPPFSPSRQAVELNSTTRLDLEGLSPEGNMSHPDVQHTVQMRSNKPGHARIMVTEDVPFTDSGYGSNSNPKHLAIVKKEDPAALNSEDGQDSRTLYSDATTVAHTEAQQFISDLSLDIYGKLRLQMNSTNWSISAKAIPELIKAFAIKIGYGSAVQANRDIMDIVTHLEAKFCQEEEDATFEDEYGEKNMSVLEKMNLWIGHSEKLHNFTSEDDLFAGVKDAEDDSIGRIGISAYSKLILESNAYNWLISSICNRSRLQYNEDRVQNSTGIVQIRQDILDRLPLAKVSRRVPPRRQEAVFRLAWDPILRCLHQELSTQTVMLEESLYEISTITGSDEAQLCSVEQYMRQTWPCNGKQVLGLLQDAIKSNSPGVTHTRVLPDKTEVTAWLHGTSLQVFAAGPAYSVAECGEQLAWLASSLRSPDDWRGLHVTHCTAAIEPLSQLSLEELPTSLARENPDSVCFNIKTVVLATSSVLPDWSDTLGRDIVIVHGFPTARRQDLGPGLEFSLKMITKLLEASYPTIQDTRVVIEGPRKTLELARQTDDVFIWHEVSPYMRTPPCFEGFALSHQRVKGVAFDLNQLSMGRHVLIPFDRQVDGKEFTHIEGIRASHSGYPTARNDLSSSPLVYDKHKPMVFNPNEDDKVRMSTDTCRMALHVSEEETSSMAMDHPGYSRSPYDTVADTPESENIGTTRACESSLDSDLLSITDFSEDTPSLARDDPLIGIITAAAISLVASYRAAASGDSSSTAGTNNFCYPNEATQPIEFPRRPMKRIRANDEEDPNEDGFHRPPPKRAKKDPTACREKSLACPYWKLDSRRYRACCTKVLNKVSFVKQHLLRKHAPDFYCQRCSSIFPTESRLQEHINNATGLLCTPSGNLAGISIHQRRLLSRKSDPKLSEENQWFAVWDILFPGIRRPISAYMDPDLSEDLSSFLEYFYNYGSTIVRAEFETSGVLQGPTSDLPSDDSWSSNLERVSYAGLNLIVEGWRSSRSSNSTFSDVASSLSSERPAESVQLAAQYERPSSSLADSGVSVAPLQSITDFPLWNSMVHSNETMPDQGTLEFGAQEGSGPLEDPYGMRFDPEEFHLGASDVGQNLRDDLADEDDG